MTLLFSVIVLFAFFGFALCKYEWKSSKFLWGSATASYQVEGAWDEEGRGLTVWDSFSHTPGKVANGDTGDVADDNYHRFKEDVQLIKAMGLNSYRFSIAWSRILPMGKGKVNKAGIDHYNALIDALLAENITPLVTLFHWDTPLALEQEFDGWLSPQIENAFVEYAGVCFKEFGDRVKHWITLNEPLTVTNLGYNSGVNAPGRCSDRTRCIEGNSATEPYIAAHNMLNSHAAVVELYRKHYQTKQQGVIGITLNADFAYPLYAESAEDQAACDRNLEFSAGWFADPVFFGKYPDSMIANVGDRLPAFTSEQQERIKGSTDFYGLNHYTSKYVANKPLPEVVATADQDQGTTGTNTDLNGSLIGPQAASPWLNVVPQGMFDLLTYLNRRYNQPVFIITENGVDVPGETEMSVADALKDTFRVNCYASYLDSVMKAMDQGVDIQGYFAWSLMDNFEWADGYAFRFGLHYVDFENGLTRYQKDSAKWYSNFTKTHPVRK